MNENILSKAARRKVDLHHFAFYRACVQHMDIGEAARRYLGEDTGMREAKETLKWICDELVHAATLRNRSDLAKRLEFAAPRRKNARAEKFPTLEEYRETRDPLNVYTESELYELYRESYPEAFQPTKLPDGTVAKDAASLLEDRLDAIAWAENNLVSTPQPADSVVGWFNGDKADAFIDGGIRTLSDLMSHIQKKGFRWWSGIKGIGETQGKRIVGWLTKHEATLGKLEPHALVPLRLLDVTPIMARKSTGICPLETFLLPKSLDGSAGENRFPGRCGIDAQNDYQAIQAWLKARAKNPNTQRAYRREAERLLLWAVMEKGMPLSSLSVDAMTEYRDWLAALGVTKPEHWRWRIPQADWLGSRNLQRWTVDWRPFDGPLSHKSQQHAFTVLKSMFEWMVKVRYLDINPMEAVAKPELQLGVDDIPDIELSRYLTRPQFKYALDYLFNKPVDPRIARLRFVIPFAYATGLRRSEMVHAKLKHIDYKPRKDGVGMRWMLRVLGKGGKVRAVPIPEIVMKELRAYFDHRGLEFAPKDAEKNDEYLIGRVLERRAEADQKKPIDPTALYNLIKEFFIEVSTDLLGKGLHEDAEHFERASTHWLRHTCGSHLAENTPASMVAELLGHASVATTSIYTHADKERLYDVVEKELGGWD